MLNSSDVNTGPNAMDKFGDWFTNQQGWANLVLPGYSMLDQLFDFKGSSAAQQQYNNQLALQQQAQGFNAEEAAKQREWEQMMSSSQYQRTMKDLQAAGLNPYLALGSMGSSGAPSGSSASSSAGSADMANNKLAQAAGILAIVLRVLLTKH